MYNEFVEGNFIPLEKRRIRLDACRQYGFKCAKLNDKPSYVAEYRSGSNVVAQRIIHVDGGFTTWIGAPRESQLFGQHLFNPGGKKLVIAQNEIETLTISQAQNLKWPVVGVSSAKDALIAIKKEYEYVDSFDEIILAFGSDTDSRNAIEQLGSMFSVGKVKVMEYKTDRETYGSANEMLCNNVDSGQIVNCIWRARQYRPDGILTLEDLKDRILAKPEPGLPLDYTELSDKIQGMRFGRLYLFTAGSGIGKSTLVHEIAYKNWWDHKVPTGIMALEERAERTAHRYIGIDLDKPIHLGWSKADEAGILTSYNSLLARGDLCFFDHWGSSQIENLLSKLRFMVHGMGCRQIVLDHISIVVSGLEEGGQGESERKTIDRLMTGLRTLVNETNIMLLAIVHLKRKGGEGKGFNEGGKVSITDLRGSASLEQLSDCIVSMERNQQKEEIKNNSLLRVLKDRDTGNTGKAGNVVYDPNTGRLLPSTDCPFEEEEHGDVSKYGF